MPVPQPGYWSELEGYADLGEVFEARTRAFRPVRAMVYNIPGELLDVDGKRFRHWSTPHSNPARAHNIAHL